MTKNEIIDLIIEALEYSNADDVQDYKNTTVEKLISMRESKEDDCTHDDRENGHCIDCGHHKDI